VPGFCSSGNVLFRFRGISQYAGGIFVCLLQRWSLCSRGICIRFDEWQAKAVCYVAFPFCFFTMRTETADASLLSGILQIMLCCKGEEHCVRACAAVMVLYIRDPRAAAVLNSQHHSPTAARSLYGTLCRQLCTVPPP